MTPGQIRTELLVQHAELRKMIEGARRCADRAREGAPVADDLLETIHLLADAVGRHNEREEHLLREIIPTADAWGQVRAGIMTEEHVQEHDSLHGTLLGMISTPCEFAGAALQVVLEGLLDHMEREERAFLNDRVLSDGVVATDPFSG